MASSLFSCGPSIALHRDAPPSKYHQKKPTCSFFSFFYLFKYYIYYFKNYYYFCLLFSHGTDEHKLPQLLLQFQRPPPPLLLLPGLDAPAPIAVLLLERVVDRVDPILVAPVFKPPNDFILARRPPLFFTPSLVAADAASDSARRLLLVVLLPPLLCGVDGCKRYLDLELLRVVNPLPLVRMGLLEGDASAPPSPLSLSSSSTS